MPDTSGSNKHGSEEHKEKANHDKDLAETLFKNGGFPDWVVTCSFYFALHCVDAYAHKLGIKSFEAKLDENMTPHGKRIRFVKNNLNAYFGWYNTLFSHCEQCRYDPEYFKLMKPNVPQTMLEDAKKFLLLLK